MSDSLNLQDAITRPKDSTEQSATILKYDRNGKGLDKLDNSKLCAESIVNGNISIFKIKAKRGGQFYNPLKDNSNYGLDKKDKVTKDDMFKLREVKETAFKNYVQFLKTKQDSFLFIAEREV
jgi:hypothetical protein